jgi:WD40 repeat protein
MRHSQRRRWLAFTILAYLIVACATPPQASGTPPAASTAETTTPDATDTPPPPTFTPPPSATPTGEPSPTLTFTPISTATTTPTLENPFPVSALFQEAQIMDLAWSPDGSKLVTVPSTTIWDAVTGQQLTVLACMDSPRTGISFLGDNVDWAIKTGNHRSIIATGIRVVEENVDVISIWDADTGERLHDFTLQDAVISIDLSPDGALLAVGALTSEDGVGITLWDVSTGQQSHRFPGFDEVKAGINYVPDVAWSPDGSVLAFITGGAYIVLWDINDPQNTRFLREEDRVPDDRIDWSPDGNLIAAGTGPRLRIWDVSTGTLVHSLERRGWVRDIRFSPDGTLLAVGSYITYGLDSAVIVDPLKGVVLHVLKGSSYTPAVAWSPDGMKLATTDGKQLLLWHVQQ